MVRLKFKWNANQSAGRRREEEVCRKLLAQIGVRAIETDLRPYEGSQAKPSQAVPS